MPFRNRKTSSMATRFEDFVKYPTFFFNSIGLQPYQLQDVERSNSILSQLLRGLVFNTGLFCLIFCIIFESIFSVIAFHSDRFVDAVMNLSYVGFCVVGIMKLTYIWYKRHQLKSFMDRLQAIFPRTYAEQEQLQLPRYLRQCTFVTSSFSFLYMVLIWTYNLYAMAEYYIWGVWLQVRIVEQSLPYNIYTPWDWRGHWSYFLLYGVEISAGYMAAAGQISSDLLLLAVATQMVMHYDHVARSIYEYRVQLGRVQSQSTNADWPRHKLRAAEEDLEYLCGIIVYHADVLGLSNMMNDVFGVPLLINFFTSSFIICFVGFEMTIGVPPDILIKLTLFFVCSMTQVYLICHYGQLLIDASVNVAQSVFHHDWSQADVRYQKMLVLIATRAQKPAWLKATSFLSVSRSTMTDIIQISYKFFALIRTMYAD